MVATRSTDRDPRWCLTASLVLAVALATVGAGCSSGGGSSSKETTGTTTAEAATCPSGLSASRPGVCVDTADPRAERFATLVARLRKEYKLRASIFGLWTGEKQLVGGALGSALPGVAASVDDHYRISNVTEGITSTLLLRLVDQGKLSLDDPVSNWLPWLPDAKKVTLRMLASSSSGYADYVTNPKFEKALLADPFRLWRPAEIIRLGVSQPSLFQPGTSWAFSDTNFMILGDVLTKAGGEPLGTQIRKQILDRLGLDQTTMAYTADVPAPTMHGYDPERGVYEDATNWSPSWAQYTGAMTSDLADMGRWARALGTGEVVSATSHKEQVGPATVGLGPLREAFYYGLGVGVAKGWIFSNPHLPGYSGFLAYYPPDKLSLVIESTPDLGNPDEVNDSQAIFVHAARLLTPDSAPNLVQRVN
jgi:D-alanyl-D-alanine carboxypeptidase